MSTDPPLAEKSEELQREIDHYSKALGVRSMRVGLRSNDDLNIYVAEDGSYHYAFYERGQLGFDRAGSLDDLLYWYCEHIVSQQAHHWVGDRAQRIQYEFQILNSYDPEWAKRNVRETAARFRSGQNAEDISLLPDIGEPL